MPKASQNFQNHAKLRPAYHFVTFPLLMAVLIWTLVMLFRAPSQEHAVLALLAFFLISVALWARIFALGVQDRVIRLEERLRFERIFPDDLRGRIPELSTDQFIALRFASDGEVVALTRRVFDEGLADRKTIKALVRDWRGDYERI